jgi:hypothetical protein
MCTVRAQPAALPGHSVKPAWAVQPTTRLAGRGTAHGGYPMAKLRTDVDPSDGVSPGTAWPEAEAMDRPR